MIPFSGRSQRPDFCTFFARHGKAPDRPVTDGRYGHGRHRRFALYAADGLGARAGERHLGAVQRGSYDNPRVFGQALAEHCRGADCGGPCDRLAGLAGALAAVSSLGEARAQAAASAGAGGGRGDSRPSREKACRGEDAAEAGREAGCAEDGLAAAGAARSCTGGRAARDAAGAERTRRGAGRVSGHALWRDGRGRAGYE